jgi:hypothetical protein
MNHKRVFSYILAHPVAIFKYFGGLGLRSGRISQDSTASVGQIVGPYELWLPQAYPGLMASKPMFLILATHQHVVLIRQDSTVRCGNEIISIRCASPGSVHERSVGGLETY